MKPILFKCSVLILLGLLSGQLFAETRDEVDPVVAAAAEGRFTRPLSEEQLSQLGPERRQDYDRWVEGYSTRQAARESHQREETRREQQTRSRTQVDQQVAQSATPGGLKYSNGGAEQGEARNCFPEAFQQMPSCPGECVFGEYCENKNGFNVYKEMQTAVNFESPLGCARLFAGSEATSMSGVALEPQKIMGATCQVIASGCKLVTTEGADPGQARLNYKKCVEQAEVKHNRSVRVGVMKCLAISSAAKATTNYEPGDKVGNAQISCKEHTGYAFDYPSCVKFTQWFNALVTAEMGLGMYNEFDKVNTGQKAQTAAAQEVQKGNGQVAGIEASKQITLSEAEVEQRNKVFFTAKAGAIGTQLGSFVTPDSLNCDNSCCDLFKSSAGADRIKGSIFFPNQEQRDRMIAEIIKSGGQAVIAAMKENEFKKRANMMQAAKEQMIGPDDESEEGIQRFCQQYPQDVRCLGPGNRVLSGSSYGQGFTGQNFGLGDLSGVAEDDFGGDTIAPGTGPQAPGQGVADVGTMDKAAADAKDVFNAPPAAGGGGGGAPAAGGGGGGVGASASANPLSKDPGVEGEKKEEPIKITSKSASYDGSSGYNGGGWRPGAKKADAAAENPFAAMFNKKQDREIASQREIDAPASDLFTKISNRYGEVQKRKGLLEVSDPSLR